MKLRAPKGEGALDARGARRRTRRPRRAGGRAALERPRASASAACSIASSASSARDDVYVELQRHLRRDEEADNHALRRSGRGVPRADRRDQRRPLRRRRPSGRSSTCSPASTTRPTSRAPAGGWRANAERYLKPPDDDGARCSPICRDALAAHARAGRSAAVHDGRSRLPLSRLSGAAGRDAGVVPAQDHARSARASATGRITIARARRSRASSISSRSSISPATS